MLFSDGKYIHLDVIKNKNTISSAENIIKEAKNPTISAKEESPKSE